MTESFKQQLQELIDQAANVYDSKFMEQGNFQTSFHCPTSFKQGCEFLMPVLIKVVEQRDDAIWNKFRSKEEYAKVFFANDLADIMDQELLQLLKGEE